MKWCAGLGLLVLTSVTGCFDKQAATSGQTGCAPDQLVISDEEDNYSSKTWTATCGDERYYCSLVGTGKETSQVNCHPAASPSSANQTTTSPGKPVAEPAAPAAATPTEQGPPKAVAGFTFGSSVAEASSACTVPGYEWQPGAQDHFRCSSAPVSLGIEAVPTVRFCKEKLCAVSLEVASRNAWLTAYAKFTDVLTKKYGRPASAKGELRSNCATEAEFESCIMTDGLELVRDWKWNTGARISLRLAAGKDAPEMKIVYVRQDQHEIVPGAL
jgi:hypothetical protein